MSLLEVQPGQRLLDRAPLLDAAPRLGLGTLTLTLTLALALTLTLTLTLTRHPIP